MKAAVIPAPCEKEEDRGIALDQWQAQLRRFRLLVGQADELTPSGFVKRIHEALPELRRTAMGAVIQIYVNSGPKEE